MKSNGSAYVALVVVVLAGYFSYQWWFNPNRAVKQRLGELAAALSVPANEAELERISRPARVRAYFADDARLRLGEGRPDITSPQQLAAALTAWTPPPTGVNVAFVDVQINVETSTTARAYFTLEISKPNPQTGQPIYETHEAKVTFAKRDGRWLITSAEPSEIQPRS